MTMTHKETAPLLSSTFRLFGYGYCSSSFWLYSSPATTVCHFSSKPHSLADSHHRFCVILSSSTLRYAFLRRRRRRRQIHHHHSRLGAGKHVHGVAKDFSPPRVITHVGCVCRSRISVTPKLWSSFHQLVRHTNDHRESRH
jgi:hypothetical protein